LDYSYRFIELHWFLLCNSVLSVFLLNFERINKRMCEQSPGVKTFRKKTQAKVLRLASGLVHDKVQCSVKVYIRRGLMHSGHRTEGRMNVGTCRGDSLAALVAWLLRY